MKFHSSVVFVKDIEQSKDFYTRFLGFSVEHDFGENVILNNGVTLWEIDPKHTISKELKTSNASNRFELYFEEEDVEKVFDVLESAGIQFLHKIHEEPWGQRTFRFFDLDNHLIEIGEPFEVFVNNMYRNGLTVIQISEKSGISVDTVEGLIKK